MLKYYVCFFKHAVHSAFHIGIGACAEKLFLRNLKPLHQARQGFLLWTFDVEGKCFIPELRSLLTFVTLCGCVFCSRRCNHLRERHS